MTPPSPTPTTDHDPEAAATAQSFLAPGEAVLRARRKDPTFDSGAVALEYAKAGETELNALLFPLLRRAWGSRSGPERPDIDLVGRPTAAEGAYQSTAS